jgi:hypothetical protein
VVSGNRVDPVPQLRAEPDQAGPVPQQRAELADLRRGDPRPGQQVRSQQLRQDRGVDFVFSELCKPSCKVAMSHQVTAAA